MASSIRFHTIIWRLVVAPPMTRTVVGCERAKLNHIVWDEEGEM